jgi:hypothetical protein
MRVLGARAKPASKGGSSTSNSRRRPLRRRSRASSKPVPTFPTSAEPRPGRPPPDARRSPRGRRRELCTLRRRTPGRGGTWSSATHPRARRYGSAHGPPCSPPLPAPSRRPARATQGRLPPRGRRRAGDRPGECARTTDARVPCGPVEMPPVARTRSDRADRTRSKAGALGQGRAGSRPRHGPRRYRGYGREPRRGPRSAIRDTPAAPGSPCARPRVAPPPHRPTGRYPQGGRPTPRPAHCRRRSA